MNKPTPKREVVVSSAFDDTKMIFLYSTEDAITEFEQYGTIYPATNRNEYMLIVDERFDFGEVLAYIESYG